MIRDYVPAGRRPAAPEALLAPARVALPDRAGRPRRRRPGPRPRQRRAPRRRGRPARLPAARQGPAAARARRRPAGRPLRHPAEAALRRRRRPPGRRGRRRAARPQRPRGPLPPRRVDDPRALRLTSASFCRLAALQRRRTSGYPVDRVSRPTVAVFGFLGFLVGSGSGMTVVVTVAGWGRRARTARRTARRRGRRRGRGTSRAAPTRSGREQVASERLAVPGDADVGRQRPCGRPRWRSGSLAGHCRLDQIASLPEVMLHGERLGATRRRCTPARPRVRSCSAITTSPPPTGVRDLGRHDDVVGGARPAGLRPAASASASAAWTCCGFAVPLRQLDRRAARGHRRRRVEAAACTAPGFVDAESAPSLDPTEQPGDREHQQRARCRAP